MYQFVIHLHTSGRQLSPTAPAVVGLGFLSIKSFLEGLPGRGIISHAIDIYRREKPPVGDLESFFALQAHKVWTPAQRNLPAGMAYEGMHINPFTPKLFVNPNQVVTGGKPVTGMRLSLEGPEFDRLSIHLQHLSNISTPLMDLMPERSPLWTGSYEVSDDMHVELKLINSSLFSHVCTAPVVCDPAWKTQFDGEVVFLVTGAQLHIQKLGNSKNVLHLRLLYTAVLEAYVPQRGWADSSVTMSRPGTSGDVQKGKLLKHIEVGEVRRGPQNGSLFTNHCLVTGAKLELKQGKICLRLHFSLMNFC